MAMLIARVLEHTTQLHLHEGALSSGLHVLAL